MFRDDVKIVLQSTSLSEWLLKVANVKGALGEDEAIAVEFVGDEAGPKRKDKGKEAEREKEKERSKASLTGPSPPVFSGHTDIRTRCSDRCLFAGLHRQVSTIIGTFP